MNSNSPVFALMTHGEIVAALGARAQQRRKKLQLSRRELSLKSGVSVPTIARFELQGVTTIAVLVKLLQALDCIDSLETLFSPTKYNSMEEFLLAEGVEQ